MSSINQRIVDLSPLKRALLAIDEMQARLDAQREPIAIIGMGCRFPGGAVDPESFWRLLENGVDAVTEIPKDRWPVDAYYDPDPAAPGKMYTRHAAFLDRVDGFDTEFFGIAPREAVSMDPQQRLLLEVAWEALENAACAPDKLAGTRTGVYLGISASDYAQRAMPSDSYDRLNPYSGTGCALSIAAGRLSYLLGLQGPSLALDTACSSSLVAVHLACQSLRVRECDVAIAGGVNLMLSPGPGIYLSKVRALAADGRCKTFDAEADGYVRGEGCGLVVLKRLSDAVTSRDRILAVIRGSAVNQDGRSGGLTAPNGPSQEAIVRQAMANAGVAPSEIGYIEAHGTGTPLGDPIELRALGAVLGKRDGVAIGSVKTNIGHLEAAAGIAGLIKTVLALQHRAIPPHLHFKSPNPHVPWSDLRFVVPTSCVSWDARRVAGVSSFGLSGTNAHVIVAEAPVPPQQAAAEDRPLHILTLSARSTTALRELIAAFIATSADNFADLCYTANTGRAHFPHRIATVAGSLDEARIALGSAVPREVRRKTPPTILFTFPDMPNTLAEQLAYAGTLRTWGIEPAYVTGEGVGELAAAVFAGAITVDEAETILKSGSQVARRAPQIGLVAAHNALPCDHTIRIERPSWPDLLALVADLYLAGAQIDWASFDRSYARRKLALPTYPFQRERYWLDTPVRRDGVDPPAAFPGRRIHSPALKDAVYESLLHRDAYPFVGDHQVYGAVVVAGACYVSMALSAGASALHELAFPEALVLEEGARHRLQLIVTPDRQFQVVSCLDSVSGNWRTHATGKLGDSGIAPAAPETLDTIRARCAEEIAGADFYQKAREAHLQLGPQFQWIDHVWRREGEALCRMRLPRPADEPEQYRLHPGLVDSCFQLIGAALFTTGELSAFVPIGIDEYRFYQRPTQVELWCHAVLRPGQDIRSSTFTADLNLIDQTGTVYAAIEGMRIRRAPRDALLRRSEDRIGEWLYEVDWQPAPRIATSPANTGTWLIVPDRAGVAEALARELTARGHRCIAELANPTDCDGVIHLATLDAEPAEPIAARSLDSALQLVQSLCKLGVKPPPLWLVTRGAQAGGGPPLAIAQAPLWGLGKVIALEHPELFCRRVDLDPAQSPADAAADLVAELLAPSAEDQIAFRDDIRYVARLRRHRASQAGESFHLDIAGRGVLDHLTLVPTSRTAPGAGQVEIRIAATGLNFRDVLNAMGMYPGDAGPMGLECAGTVTAIGEGVTGVSVGDEVVAVAPGSFSRYVVTYTPFVVPKPPGMSFAEAATIPIAFLTAHHCLRNLARITAGDRVLIHAAAGGVGLAAVQLAQLAGAEVFATAGSPEKQEFLRSLGVQHIASSRTLDFAGEFRAITGGRGVDIVLNSLAGDFIASSFALLAPHGRFVEIGKTGVWSQEQAAAARRDIAYSVYDLARHCQEEPLQVGAMLRELMHLFTGGKLRPLPLHAFKIDDIVSAFRFMQQARHMGKIVVTQDAEREDIPVEFRADATYLITGGLGGLGLLTAEWMVDRGARHLVLIGRSNPAPAEAEALRRLRQRTITLRIERADVADRDQMKHVLDDIATSMPPLRGIVHSAGVLDDGIIQEQNWTRFAAVLAPKVSGAWNLHTLTQGMPLDFFVLYSSIVSVIGSPGQSNHTAANSFLDALAHYRRAAGLPALSINWGAWSEIGAAARRNVGPRVRMQGMAEIPPAEGLRVLEKLWHSPSAQVGVLPVDWSDVFRRNPAAAESPFLTALASEVRARAPIEVSSAARTDLLRRLENARPSERQEVLLSCVQAEAAKVLGLDASRTLDPRRPLNEIGLDSLMAVELRNALGHLAGRMLPVTLLFDYPTIQGLTEYLAAEAFALDTDAPEAPVWVAAAASELSGDELLASLDRELASLDQWMDS